mgnify:CR=1 FL=1
MGRKKTTIELGKFKTRINNALLTDENIQEILTGTTGNSREQFEKTKKQIHSHLFIDDTIKDTGTYIFYEVFMPELRSQIKNIRVVMYAICHRDILENYSKEGFWGNRADILAEMIEDAMLNPTVLREFGIGELVLDNIDIYNSTEFYGRIIVFTVPNFR